MLCVIAPLVVAEIKRLLCEGVSQRDIARRIGVSRTTVGAIATGKRQEQAVEKEAVAEPGPDLLSLPTRCNRCGYKVHLPCQVCRVRGFISKTTQRTA